MKNRILIMFVTFACLLGAYLLYYVCVQDFRVDKVRRSMPTDTMPGDPSALPGMAGLARGKVRDIVVTSTDKKNRVEAVYKAQEWSRQGDRYFFKWPRVEWYRSTGEVIYIEANFGIARMEDVANKPSPNIQDGILRGNVQITIDRSKTPLATRTPINTRPEDAVTVLLDEAQFDGENFTVASLEHVSVFSKQGDIFGKGLLLAWSEGPRELRELRIDAGEYMIIREGQDRFMADMKLPGSSRDSDSTDVPATPAASRPVVAQPPSAVSSPREKPAATKPATSRPGKPPAVQTAETYQVELKENVTVTAGSRSLRGADELTLMFESKSVSDTKDSSSQPAGAGRSGSPAQPTRKGEPMIVTWSGPMVLKPVRDVEPEAKRVVVRATGKRLDLADGDSSATCKSLYFKSPQRQAILEGSELEPVEVAMANGTTLWAKTLDFDQETGLVKLLGEGKMFMPAGNGGDVSFGDVAPAAATTAPAENVEMAIAWRDSLIATLEPQPAGGKRRMDVLKSAVVKGQVSVKHGLTRTMTGDELTVNFHQPQKSDDPINRIKDLHAIGNVSLTDSLTGDFIKARNLDVTMTGLDQGRSRPAEALATGDVSARQSRAAADGSRAPTDITGADKLIVTFADATDPASGKVKLGQPQRLQAAGKLLVRDASGADPVLAEAATIDADVPNGTAVLTGAPARLAQKDNFLTGDKIFLERDSEHVTVPGKGTMRFWSDADLIGNRLDAVGPVDTAATPADHRLVVKPQPASAPTTQKARVPRPVDIAWSGRMDYQGKDRKAVIDDHVRLLTAGDSLYCEKLNVFFAAADDAASRPARSATSRPKSPNIQFTVNKLAMVEADKNARLESAADDAEGYQLRRLLLQTDHFVYDAATRVLSCDKAGTLLVEDYRSPDPKVRKQEELSPTGNIERPSQTAFRWNRSMQMDQTNRTMRMDGAVRMVHVSGSQLVLRDKLKLRPWGNLPSGRNTSLDCDHMLAMFGPPDDKNAGVRARDPEAGPQLGPLEMFDAFGVKEQADDLIRLDDAPREVHCRRIVYQGKDGADPSRADTVVLMGSLPGEPVRPAVVYVTEKGHTDTVKGDKLVWDRKTNKIEIPRMEAGGRR